MVGPDDSPQSTAALEWAAAEGVCRGLPLHLVHAVQPPLWPGPIRTSEVADVPTECLSDARQALDQSFTGLTVTWSQPLGAALPALVWASRYAALVVIGTRGHGPIRQIVSGSTAVELTPIRTARS